MCALFSRIIFIANELFLDCQSFVVSSCKNITTIIRMSSQLHFHPLKSPTCEVKILKLWGAICVKSVLFVHTYKCDGMYINAMA